MLRHAMLSSSHLLSYPFLSNLIPVFDVIRRNPFLLSISPTLDHHYLVDQPQNVYHFKAFKASISFATITFLLSVSLSSSLYTPLLLNILNLPFSNRTEGSWSLSLKRAVRHTTSLRKREGERERQRERERERERGRERERKTERSKMFKGV